MRRRELQFAAREVAPGVYTFQSVVPVRSRHGDMVKTHNPHARLQSEHAVARRGFDTAFLIDHAQAQRATVPEGEAARQRSVIVQVTLGDIAARAKRRERENREYAEEMIRAASQSIAFRGDADTLYTGVYPNVTDQYRDFDIDPDRWERLFVRDAQYRKEKHDERRGRQRGKGYVMGKQSYSQNYTHRIILTEL